MAEDSRRRPYSGDFDRSYNKRSRFDHYEERDHRYQPRGSGGGRFEDRRGSGGQRHNEVLDDDLIMCPTYEQWRHKSAENETVAQYREFVQNWLNNRSDTFARRHWKEDWFLEKYDPERAVEKMKERSQGVLKRAGELDASKLVSLIQSSEKDAVITGVETHLEEACCAYIPHVPPFLPRPALEKALQAEGATAVYLSEVNRSKKRRDLGRRGTVVFKDNQAAKDCMAKGFVACWVTMDPDGVNWESVSPKDDRRTEMSVNIINYKSLPNRILPKEAGSPERLERDEKQAIACAEVLDKAHNVESGGIRAVLAAKPSFVSALDAAVQYLRYVHLYCYYSAALCRDYGELIHKAATPFLRPSIAHSSSSSTTVVATGGPEAITTNEGGEAASTTGKELQAETAEENAVETERPQQSSGLGRDQHETDPRRLFEIIDASAERIMTGYVEQHRAELERLDDALRRRVQIANDAFEAFVAQNLVMKNSHVYCQTHDKLFQNEMFFRKHLVNFHSAAIRSTQRKALLDLFFELFKHDDDKPLPRLPKFVDDVLRGEFVPPPDREPRLSSSSSGGHLGRFPSRDEGRIGSVPELKSEPGVRRYRDPDAPNPGIIVEKPKKLQYRTRVSHGGPL